LTTKEQLQQALGGCFDVQATVAGAPARSSARTPPASTLHA
jgi:hypothetical protein